jgi:hypothetical protein
VNLNKAKMMNLMQSIHLEDVLTEKQRTPRLQIVMIICAPVSCEPGYCVLTGKVGSCFVWCQLSFANPPERNIHGGNGPDWG